MYTYIYDEFCQSPRHHSTLATIEERLMELGISGKICRLSALKNIHAVVEQEVRQGAKTIVAVGDDTTVERVFNVLAGVQKTLVMGIIPVAGRNDIAKNLKIPVGVQACSILSYRMIRTLCLGKINNRFFISTVAVDGRHIELECDHTFRIKPRGTEQIHVLITNHADDSVRATRGSLKLEVTPVTGFPGSRHRNAPSSFLNSFITITAPDRFPIFVDDHQVLAQPPVTIETTNKRLQVITGYLRPSLLRATER